MRLVKSFIPLLFAAMFLTFPAAAQQGKSSSTPPAIANAAPVVPAEELVHIATLQRDVAAEGNQLSQIKEYFQQVQAQQTAKQKELQDALAAIRQGVDPHKWTFNESTLKWEPVVQAPTSPPAPAVPATPEKK
jgi:hypothetical protein